MFQAKNFKIFSCQCSIFTPLLTFSPNKIHIAIAGKYAEILNGNPVLLPLPEDAPKEIPRIILSSGDGKLKLEIANSRVNFFRFRKESDTEIDFPSFLELNLSIVKDYIECTSAKIGRIALVIRRFVETEDPGKILAKHFCKEKFCMEDSKLSCFNRPENFEIHSHKKYPLPKSKTIVNSWVRCKSGLLKNIKQPIVFVEQDFNTLAEDQDKLDYDAERIAAFYMESFNEQAEILKKYFP
ncbi:MAG: hypothetical protein ABIJ41_06460 [Candidatus Omnitrophota bacterium]